MTSAWLSRLVAECRARTPSADRRSKGMSADAGPPGPKSWHVMIRQIDSDRLAPSGASAWLRTPEAANHPVASGDRPGARIDRRAQAGRARGRVASDFAAPTTRCGRRTMRTEGRKLRRAIPPSEANAARPTLVTYHLYNKARMSGPAVTKKSAYPSRARLGCARQGGRPMGTWTPRGRRCHPHAALFH